MKNLRLVGAFASLVVVSGMAVARQPDVYRPVTDARLRSPAPEDWLMYRRTYDGWGYSPLNQITTDNIASLRPVWSASTGVAEGHEAPALVNDGIMFVSTPQSQVLALDARTGEIRWRYRRQLPDGLLQFHPTNRGVGLYEDKVYVATVDAFVVALDAATGTMVWETAVEDHRVGYYIDDGAAGRQRQGDGRGVRRRARHLRVRHGSRCRERRRGLEDLHDPGAR